MLRIACIYWDISSCGGVATHLNNLKIAANKLGDRFDIFLVKPWKTRTPKLYENRVSIASKDCRIWVDGELSCGESQVHNSVKWLEANYDLILTSTVCPYEANQRWPTQEFLPFYDCKLPKVSWVMDGAWGAIKHWAEPLLSKFRGIACPLESYAAPVKATGYPNIKIIPFPFVPYPITELRSTPPSIIWPNQWKDIKGITKFLDQLPKFYNSEATKNLKVDLYSGGIRYYQLRKTKLWDAAINIDKFQGYNGHGKAVYYGFVDHPELIKAIQKSWITVNLQGHSSRAVAYRNGSYNNTEVESLYYGVCPILHVSTLQTNLPKETYITVDKAEQLPTTIQNIVKSGFALDPKRQQRAMEFVLDTHSAIKIYKSLTSLWV